MFASSVSVLHIRVRKGGVSWQKALWTGGRIFWRCQLEFMAGHPAARTFDYENA